MLAVGCLLGLVLVQTANGSVAPLPPCQQTGFPETAVTPRDPEEAAAWWEVMGQKGSLAEEYRVLWRQMRADQAQLPISAAIQGDPAALRSVICALWSHYGAAELNEANQWFLAGVVAESSAAVARQASPRRRRWLAEQLLAYLDQGGATVEPQIPALLATALTRLQPDDQELLDFSRQLAADAVQWELEIAGVRGDQPSEEVLDSATAVFGPALALDAYELLEPGPAIPPACHRQACAALVEVLDRLANPPANEERGHWESTVAQVLRQATRLALRPCGDGRVRTDLQCRLAVVLRTIARTPGLGRESRIIAAVNESLLRLAQRNTLVGVRPWRYWYQAVRALRGSRFSLQLARYLRRRFAHVDLHHPLDDDAQRALRRLALRSTGDTETPSQIHAPAPQP